MKKVIDRVIFGLNNNETYIDFWNPVSKIYSLKFNVVPTLFFVGTEDEFNILSEQGRLSTKYGEVFHLQRPDNIPYNIQHEQHADWTPTWALFYGASKFEDEVCMLSGIDQMPLSSHFFELTKSINAREKYILGFGDAYTCIGTTKTVTIDNEKIYFVYPTSHHVATSKMYKEIYEIEDDWISEIEKVNNFRGKLILSESYSSYAAGNGWGTDEIYSSYLIGKAMDMNNIRFEIVEGFFTDWEAHNMTGFRNGPFFLGPDLEQRIINGDLYEYCLGKPASSNDKYSLERLADILPEYKNIV